MVLSYDAISVNPVRPPFCRCGNHRFHVHSYYWRIVAQVLIHRFICLACKRTVSMIPNHCVPYKHHPVSVINPTLDCMIVTGRSAKDGGCQAAEVIHHSTAYRWRRQFSQFCSVLATEGAKRLGIASISGSVRTVYQTIKSYFSDLQPHFFTEFQVALCRQPPPIGVFRSFSF